MHERVIQKRQILDSFLVNHFYGTKLSRFTDTMPHKNIRKPEVLLMISGSIVPENIRNHSDIAKNIDKKTNKNIAKFFDKITKVFHCFT